MIKTQGGFLISQIKQIGGRVFERILSAEGIDAFNGAQGRILYVLWEKEAVTAAKLSKLTGLAPTTLTSMLDRMEAAALLQRVSDPNDRRKIRIVLTAYARSLQSRYDLVSGKTSEIFYRGFSDSEILAFENQLRRIVSNLSREEA